MASSLTDKEREAQRILDGDAGRLAVAIIEALSGLGGQRTAFLSYRSIGNLVGRGPDSADLLHTIAVLSSPKLNVLKPMFVYQAVDGEEVILSPKEWSEAKRNGYLVDPHSGEKVERFQDVTFPYFKTTDEFSSMVGTTK